MQLKLELLAPARDSAIGTAAIDCGADAVYMAGPSFGARVAAANKVSDLEAVARYAHRYGARLYATVNTLLDEEELPEAERLIRQYYEAGVDALIIQDMRLLELNLPPIELHASTQAIVRTPERAAQLEKAGLSRIILERQLSLEQIRAIRRAVSCEIECFVHGALCVGYSGQCFLSEYLTGRSANRGCCAQPCRSLYDLVDAGGRMVAADRALLSLKDFRLDSHIGELADAGVCSFKIEGRLKNASYVKNIVRHYRGVLDSFIEQRPEYGKASFGRLAGGFTPDPDLTFNRGYTTCFIDGKRGTWNSADVARSKGEYLGEIEKIKGHEVILKPSKELSVWPLSNGDGLSFVVREGEAVGMRADLGSGNTASVKDTSSLRPGMKVYRNFNVKFERELEKNMPERLMDAAVFYRSRSGHTVVEARAEDGRTATVEFDEAAQEARKRELAEETLRCCLGKTSGPYSFHLETIESDRIYFYTAAYLNSLRNRLSEMLQASAPQREAAAPRPAASSVPPTLRTAPDGELLRTKYCIKYELGLCPKQGGGLSVREPLFLVNQNRRFQLRFDCKNCEMIVTL